MRRPSAGAFAAAGADMEVINTHKGGRMLSPITSAIYNISNFYYQNSQTMSSTLERLSTGKKFQTPADDIGGYMHAQDLQSQSSGYDNILNNLSEWKGVMGVANSAATEISNSLQRMNELINESEQSTDNTQKDSDQAEFNQLYAKISNIVTNTSYDSMNIMNDKAVMATLYLNPDTSTGSDMQIQFAAESIPQADLTPLNGLKIDHTATTGPGGTYDTASKAVATAQTDINNFVAQAAGYSNALDSYYNVCSSAKTNLTDAVSSISDTDDATDIAAYTAQSIQQQAAIAMLAQANLDNRNVLALFNFSGM
jgi:flagellin